MNYWKKIFFNIFFLSYGAMMYSCSSLAPSVAKVPIDSQSSSARRSSTFTQERFPASRRLVKSGCFSMLIPLLKEGRIYSDEGISAAAMDKKGLLNFVDYEDLQNSSFWQDVVAREGMTQRDEELGFMALAMIKKKHPEITEEGLKDRFEVLKAFCGRSY